ncbi:capsule assembly Wzi family protein [Aliiglaciecola sp. LCG003]|uniref:capsule assembly Wzi family protein n=1 Tax=Aliiglaciecola sp. LCG003 TaxID=3053655 RepID=UPI002573F644|nr:capsule assembly Wzi family protein [Aliiglaciecola sp. LCG003]WJG09510.1 capsule assembly Wzi family protein [Aliiglaciecola sp. LCG003]
MPRITLLLVIFAVFFYSNTLKASPWVGTIDPQLHYDVQVLTEFGYLDTTATTFPLPWKGIAKQLERLNLSGMPDTAKVSAKRLIHYLILQKRNTTFSSVTAYGATERSRFASFDGQQGEKARMKFSTETRYKRLATKISVNLEPNGEKNYDQSFLAVQLGDWNLRVGSIDQWWGPAHSNSLLFSNNARPIPTLALSRSTSEPSESPWLGFLGPWYATAQVGQLEDSRDVPDAKIWASRFVSKPVNGLELGLSWIAVWGGDGQPDRFQDIFKVLTFHKRCAQDIIECTDDQKTHVGSHLLGIDFKYTFNIAQQPFNLYAQYIDEGDSGEFNVANSANSFGISTYWYGAKVYLEKSDTNVSCDNAVIDVTSCFYESGTYSSGYRYYSRELGDNRESDADMLSLGVLKHFVDGDVIEASIRHIRIDDAEIFSRNLTSLKGITEKITQVSGYYQTVWGDWQLKVGAVLDSSKVNQQGTDHDLMVFSELKYSLL